MSYYGDIPLKKFIRLLFDQSQQTKQAVEILVVILRARSFRLSEIAAQMCPSL